MNKILVAVIAVALIASGCKSNQDQTLAKKPTALIKGPAD